MSLRFDGRVVLVSGGGGGLGRAYCLEFARRGASVVVNDLGGPMKGDSGSSTRAADAVVAEIRAAGGRAVPNYDSVLDGAKLVATAIDAFGRLDVVVNNAGILRDISFHKMSEKDWDLVHAVHLKGAYSVLKAAWPIFREQRYGRVINTSSAAGLYGNFGQANYSSAKLALVGFARALAKEGQKRNIFVNSIAPVAGSRMTETVMPPELVAALRPEFVAPVVVYLCHESSDVTGRVFECGAGFVTETRWQQAAGLVDSNLTAESVRDGWSRVETFDDRATYPESPGDSTAAVLAALETQRAKL